MLCYKHKIPTCVSSATTNIFFAVFAMSSIGIGLAYSNYEINELKDKNDEIQQIEDTKIERRLKDTFALDVIDRKNETRPVISFHGIVYFIVAIICIIGVLINELISNVIIIEQLRSWALAIALIIICTIGLLMCYKRGLLNLIAKYDKIIDDAQSVLEGEYKKLFHR